MTYSLLEGMKGSKLREDQFADVSLLFNYAQDRVPVMAKNIGGIQRPLVIAPDVVRSSGGNTPATSGSFDIGKFTSEEQKLIVLSSPKPVILRPTLFNPAAKRDNLKLSKIMEEQLRALSYASTRGGQNSIVYVEADEMTDAIIPSGTYTMEGETLTVSVVLYRNDQQVGKEITVSGKVSEKETLIKTLVAQIIEMKQ